MITDCTDCTQTVPSDRGLGQTALTAQDVEVRDRLIVAQEALLNSYRCLFNIDTEIVPGGCTENSASQSPVHSPPFAATPTAIDIGSRDRLIIAQEALLNSYRCLFNIDTEIVPGGCPYVPTLEEQ